MAEIALVSAKKIRLKHQAEKGSLMAKRALQLAEQPDKFLSTTQIGITLTGILLGMYSGDALGQKLEPIFREIPTIAHLSSTLATIVSLTFITYITLVLAELLPKRIGLSNPETIAKLVALPMSFLQSLVYPFTWILGTSTSLLLSLLRITKSPDSQVTEEEIKALLQQGAETGVVEEIEQDIVRRAFFLGDVKISSLMTHRNDIVWVDVKKTMSENMELMRSEIHSVYPIGDGTLERIIGMVHLKDLYLRDINDFSPESLKDLIQDPLVILENMDAYTVLEIFKTHRRHQAMILDEFGGVVGMVTLNDILEALVGDISDAPHQEYQIIQRDEHSYLVDGQYSFYDFVTYFDLEYGDFSEESFKTVAGFLLHHLRHIPKEGEQYTWERFTFEIVDMDGNKIDKLLVTLRPLDQEAP